MKIHFHYNQILFHFHRHSWIIQIREKMKKNDWDVHLKKPPVGCSLAEVNTHTSQVKVLQRKKKGLTAIPGHSLWSKRVRWSRLAVFGGIVPPKDASVRLRHLNYLSDPRTPRPFPFHPNTPICSTSLSSPFLLAFWK